MTLCFDVASYIIEFSKERGMESLSERDELLQKIIELSEKMSESNSKISEIEDF